jgi:hypothetical protein
MGKKRPASVYAGLMAWILATLMAGFARGAASTILLVRPSSCHLRFGQQQGERHGEEKRT